MLPLWREKRCVMAKEDKDKEQMEAGGGVSAGGGAAEPPAARGRARLAERMKKSLGERWTDDEDANADAWLDDMDKADEDNRQRREMDTKLGEALANDSRLAAALGDVMQNKRGAGAALARYYGRDLLTAEEGSDEYKELMEAEEERRKEAEELLAAEQAYDKNVERTMPEVERFCKENNKDVEAFKQQLWEKIIFPVMNGEYTQELCQIVLHGLDYDSDIEDAKAAGRIMGRNDNIERLRENREAGQMTSGFGGAAMPPERKPEKKPRRDAAFLAAEQA